MLHLRQLILAGQAAEALKETENATDIPGLDLADAVVVGQLAEFFDRHDAFAQARNLYLRLLELQPADSQAHYQLAKVLHFLGDIDGAEDHCDRAIGLDARNFDALFLRSGLRRQSPDANHIDPLNDLLLEQIPNPEQYAKASFALAKELEDCARYSESFTVRQTGAKRYRQSLDYDFDEDLAFVREIGPTYQAGLFDGGIPGFDNDEAIFIVGLPRTGTTLLERIVCSHDAVHSAGELTNFTHALVTQMQKLGVEEPPSRAEMVKLTPRLDFQSLGELYINSTRLRTGRAPRFIDKFPQNCLYAGPIHLALPGARILLLERHPLDVCYSVYKQLFTEIYQFSYDLDELAAYFIAHQELMSHWQAILPDAVMTVRYENLVHDLEDETRRVLDFCGLDFQQQCLEFHRNRQASTTASATQVRQKLYSSSIGMWQNYAEELHPLKDRLERAGCLEGW